MLTYDANLSSKLSAVFTTLMMKNSELRGVQLTGGGVSAVPGGTNKAWTKFSAPGDTDDDCARKAAAKYGLLIEDAIYSINVALHVWPFLYVHVHMPYKGQQAAATVYAIHFHNTTD